METVAVDSDRLFCAARLRFDNRADVVEGARQFHLYRLRCPESGSNREAMARV